MTTLEQDTKQLADWLLTDPETGSRLTFAGPLEPDFLRMSRVKMVNAEGEVWTLTAGLQEGYLTASERLANIRQADAEAEAEAAARASKDRAQPSPLELENISRILATEIESSIFEEHVAPALVIVQKVIDDEIRPAKAASDIAKLMHAAADECLSPDQRELFDQLEPGGSDTYTRLFRCVAKRIAAQPAVAPIANAALCGTALGFEESTEPIEGEVLSAAPQPSDN